MKLFSRIASAFQPSIKPARPSQAADASPSSIEWPMNTPTSDLNLWMQQMSRAQMLLEELGDLPDLSAGRPIEKLILGGPSMPVRPHTLLEPARVSGPEELSQRLHANKLTGGVVVMATPTTSESRLWHWQAEEHGVTHVVRLRCELEDANLRLDPAVVTAFSRRPDIQANGALSRHRDVRLAPRSAIPPSLLLNTFEALAADPPAPDAYVAFQSYEGDDRSAVFGAGWKIYKDLRQMTKAGRPLDDDAIEQVVSEAVLQIKTNRSAQLLSEPVHVASLLAMGHQLADRLRTRRVRFLAQPQVKVESAGPVEPIRPGPRHAAALRSAVAGAWCSEIREDPALRSLSFAPLEGSRAVERRIRCERRFEPDERLEESPHRPLRGAWATPATLVLESLTSDHALALAVACLKHNIGAVFDLTHPSEPAARAEPHPMARGSRSFDGDCSVTFDWGRSGERPLEEDMPGATSIGMWVSARVKGEAVTRDLSVDPKEMSEAEPNPATRPVELIKRALSPGQPVPPRALFDLARIMERFRAEGPGHTLALVCPDGDLRAAAVAAADLVYSRFMADELTEDNRLDTVRDIWAGLCREYSVDMADQPEQLAHLIGMSELLIDTGQKTPRWF